MKQVFAIAAIMIGCAFGIGWLTADFNKAPIAEKKKDESKKDKKSCKCCDSCGCKSCK